jgi:uncharacterized membrane protein
MFITDHFPTADPILTNPIFQWIVAIVCALLLLYTIGSIASRVIGKKVIELMETLIGRIPFVQTIYSASKKLIVMLQQKPDEAARIVLIDYPHPGMKTIGLVTRVSDSRPARNSPRSMRPRSIPPNYAIVPMSSLLPTSMTMDQAMTMIAPPAPWVPRLSMLPKEDTLRVSPRASDPFFRSQKESAAQPFGARARRCSLR